MIGQIAGIAREELIYTFATVHQRLSTRGRCARYPVIVNGSPKTGTTWMLRLITSLPGHRDVGNFNGAIDRYRTVIRGDVAHGHDYYTPELAAILQQNSTKVVLMVRDPRDQLVSRMFHLRRDRTNPWHRRVRDLPEDALLMTSIEGLPGGMPGIQQLLQLTGSWVTGGADAMVVRFEALKAQPVALLTEVCNYLEIEAHPRLVAVVVAKNRFERLTVGRKIWRLARPPGTADPTSHFRKGIVGDWRNYFTESHKARFKELAGETLIELGYEKDMNW